MQAHAATFRPDGRDLARRLAKIGRRGLASAEKNAVPLDLLLSVQLNMGALAVMIEAQGGDAAEALKPLPEPPNAAGEAVGAGKDVE